MNKKGRLPLDITDLAVSVIVFLILMGLFSFYISSQKKAVENELDERAMDVERDRFLIDYLKTPITETNLAKKGVYFENMQKKIDFMKSQNMVIADLFVMTAADRSNVDVLRRMNEDEFNNHEIYIIYPDGTSAMITQGICSMGETSVAYIPLEDGTKVGVRLKLCPTK